MLNIRTQDRMALVPYNSTTKIFANYKYPNNDAISFDILTNITSSNWDKLGTYATKERALEVLDEIDKILNKCPINLSIVYQMPKE